MRTCPDSCAGVDASQAGWAPCIHHEGLVDREEALQPLGAGRGQDLVAWSLELGRLLAEAGKLNFRAAGTCMVPTVLPGDVLHIKTKPVQQIQVGEIAVVRRAGLLFGHRTFATGEDAYGPYILTRPDTSLDGSDPPAHDQDVLGVVDHIERRGQVLGTARVEPNRGTAPSPALGEAWSTWIRPARQRMLSGLAFLQQVKGYRWLVDRWLAGVSHRLGYVAQIPFRSQAPTPLMQKLTGPQLEAFDLRASGNEPAYWSLALRLGARVAASLSFYCRPQGCPYAGWWIAGFQVRMRYRGTCVEARLFDKAQGIFARSGESALRVCLPKDSPEVLRWSREMGFRRMSLDPIPGDDCVGTRPGNCIELVKII